MTPSAAGTLPTVPIPKLGRQATRLGLGGFHQLEISSEVVGEVVDAYLAEGGNYIETARGYGGGASEEKLGAALEGRRDEVILVSKSGAKSADDVRRDLEASLRALRTDRLDIYFFHGVGPEKLRTITAPGGAVEGLTRARDEGLVGGFGVSSHQPATYLDAIEQIDLAVILVWFNYLDNLNFPIIPDRIVPACREAGVSLTAMKPLADGLLWRSVDDAMGYCLGAGAEVAVCGTNGPEQVRQVAEAVRQGPAGDAERTRIQRDAPELGRYVCRRCGQCGPSLMRLFELEGVFDRQMIDLLPHDAGEYHVRKNLAGWFNAADRAIEAFQQMQRTEEDLLDKAREVACPFDIDVPRKARIAVCKLTDGDLSRI